MESVREAYRKCKGSLWECTGAIQKVYRSVREGYGCYSHQPKSVRGQYGSVRVGYGKYGRLHVEATLGN